MICASTATQMDAVCDDQQSESQALSSGPPVPKRKRVLIADDSVVFLGALGMKLRNHGYDVILCPEAARVAAVARSEKPDLILLDINFPPDPAHAQGEVWDGFLVL